MKFDKRKKLQIEGIREKLAVDISCSICHCHGLSRHLIFENLDSSFRIIFFDLIKVSS